MKEKQKLEAKAGKPKQKRLPDADGNSEHDKMEIQRFPQNPSHKDKETGKRQSKTNGQVSRNQRKRAESDSVMVDQKLSKHEHQRQRKSGGQQNQEKKTAIDNKMKQTGQKHEGNDQIPNAEVNANPSKTTPKIDDDGIQRPVEVQTKSKNQLRKEKLQLLREKQRSRRETSKEKRRKAASETEPPTVSSQGQQKQNQEHGRQVGVESEERRRRLKREADDVLDRLATSAMPPRGKTPNLVCEFRFWCKRV